MCVPQTDEIMLQIPEHLMMSPPRALSDEEIGPALHESQGAVRSDLVRVVCECAWLWLL